MNTNTPQFSDSRPTTPTARNPNPQNHPQGYAQGAPYANPQENASSGTLSAGSTSASAAGSGVEQVKIRSGLLKIRIISGQGLSLPEGFDIPDPIARAIASHSNTSGGNNNNNTQLGMSSSLLSASSPSALALQQRRVPGGGGSISNRDFLARKQQWWLPYVVLEFDKNEVLVDALGGDLGNPTWMYSATFDVSRISDISLQIYLRNTSPALKENGGRGGLPSGSDGAGEGGEDSNNAEMGNQDLCLGGIRFTPNFESGQLMDEWLPLTLGSGGGGGGGGNVHVQVAFKPSTAHLTIDSFELLKVIGKGSFGKVSWFGSWFLLLLFSSLLHACVLERPSTGDVVD